MDLRQSELFLTIMMYSYVIWLEQFIVSKCDSYRSRTSLLFRAIAKHGSTSPFSDALCPSNAEDQVKFYNKFGLYLKSIYINLFKKKLHAPVEAGSHKHSQSAK
jgi:hypothetical protein